MPVAVFLQLVCQIRSRADYDAVLQQQLNSSFSSNFPDFVMLSDSFGGLRVRSCKVIKE